MKIANPPNPSQPALKELPKKDNLIADPFQLGEPAPDAMRTLVNALLGSEEGKALLERVLTKYLAPPLTSANITAASIISAGRGLLPMETARIAERFADTGAVGYAGAEIAPKDKIALGSITGATAGAGAGMVAVVEVLRSAAHADPHGFGHALATVLGFTAMGGAAGAAMGGGLVGEVAVGPATVKAAAS